MSLVLSYSNLLSSSTSLDIRQTLAVCFSSLSLLLVSLSLQVAIIAFLSSFVLNLYFSPIFWINGQSFNKGHGIPHLQQEAMLALSLLENLPSEDFSFHLNMDPFWLNPLWLNLFFSPILSRPWTIKENTSSSLSLDSSSFEVQSSCMAFEAIVKLVERYKFNHYFNY